MRIEIQEFFISDNSRQCTFSFIQLFDNLIFLFLCYYYAFSYFRCGKCHRYLKFIDSRPQRLHCSICNETYTLPQNGTIRPYKTEKCPLDKFELLCYTQGGKGRVGFFFIIYCINL